MVVANRDRLRRGLDLLKEGLVPFVESELHARIGEDWIERARERVKHLKVEKQAVRWDVHATLKAMWEFWNDVFRHRLGRDERSYVSELQGMRNRWAHEEPFSSDDVYRALDTMQRLLQAISAGPAVEALGEQKAELQRQVFQEQARNKVRYQPTFEGMASAGLKPWREIVTPHPDVASGHFMQAEFAADLAQVHRGEGSGEYTDPVEFFHRTYLTEGLHDLLVGALQRLSGQDADPVVELQTNFGGGKTHSMLALYHLFSGVESGRLQGLERVLGEAGVTQAPTARRAVLVGTALSPADAMVKEDGTRVQTLWGELAWQLGGPEAYALVAESDARRTSPGSEALGELLRRCSPCLVLIDEWVAYARQTIERDDLPAGEFSSQATFAQALTEAAKRAPEALVVASIPASKIEIGDQKGEHAVEVLKNVFERVAKPWRPAAGDETFEIVRRRLFEPITGKDHHAARDAVIEEFAKLYRSNAGDFPGECGQGDYRDKLRSAFPIHPELFRRLYDDWSTLDRFQRTRGVLRLLAKVIHRLWEDQDAALLIFPASVPMHDPAVKSELTRYLSDPWDPIISQDVDGPDSMPLALDQENPNLGRYSACRRVARTLFIGTAPGSGTNSPGIGDQRVRLGCAQPGESIATFGDALRRVSDRGRYIHQDGNRHWLSTRPNLNRTAEDRAAQLLRQPEELDAEIVRRLRKDRSRGEFAGVHICPESTSEVPDEPEARLVILAPEQSHRRGQKKETPALVAAGEFLDSARAPRLNRNAVVFLAPDGKVLEDLRQAVAHYLAWQSIRKDYRSLNLDAFQQSQAEGKTDEFDKAVDLRIDGAWIHALCPRQENPRRSAEEGGTAGPPATLWDEVRVSGDGPLPVRTAKKLVQEELLLSKMAGVRLRMDLDEHLWRDRDHVSLGELAEWFPRYLYLPRVTSRRTLEGAIQDGARLLSVDDAFAVADRYDGEEGRYLGLRIARGAPEALTDATVLVKPEVAGQQQAAADDTTGTTDDPAPPPAVVGPEPGPGNGGNPVVTVQEPTVFVGSVGLDPMRIGKEAGKIAEEVVQHLSTLPGARARVQVEIHVEVPGGIGEKVARTVTENATTLGFDHASFE